MSIFLDKAETVKVDEKEFIEPLDASEKIIGCL
jgi:hypothetical protein